MRTLSIDIESYCETDIKTGTYKYAENAEVILFAYSFDEGPTEVVDTTWEDLPKEVLMALTNPEVLKTSFNAAFERAVIGKYYGLYLPPEQWECSMVRSAMAGYPLSLDESSKALGLTEKKDAVGKALIRYFCMPCKPSKTNGMRARNMPDDNIEKWKQFIEYCRQDVIVEKQVRKALMWYKIPPIEKELWCLDQRKNERGVKVDLELINAAIVLDDRFREKLTEEAVTITGLGNVNSPAQLKKWLAEETDSEEIKSLDKLAVAKLLEKVDSEKAKRILEIRALMSKSSIKKYLSMRNAAGVGNRIRGMIQYYGAQKSGRESGRICQPQNYPRIQDEFVNLVDDTRQLVKNLDMQSLNMIFDSLSSVLSQLLRTTFIADKGKEFGVLDFKAVEAVALSFIADEKWRIDFFRKGGDIYVASAMTMFRLKKEDVTKDIRQKSKIAELLCIEENQLVLTDHGTVPIKNVSLTHKVWDGEHFVTHEGVIYKGIKEVITYGGLTATKDHIVWSAEGTQLQFGELATRGSHLLQSGNSGQAIRVGKNNQSRKKMEQGLVQSNGFGSMHRMQNYKMVRPFYFKSRKIPRLQYLYSVRNASLVKSTFRCRSKTVQQSTISSIPQLRRSRYNLQFSFSSGGGIMDNSKFRFAGQKIGIGQNRQQFTLSTWKHTICTSGSKSSQSSSNSFSGMESRRMALCSKRSYSNAFERNDERTNIPRGTVNYPTETKELAKDTRKARVYDIINCGPHNRYTVSNVLVHNCGYGGTKPAMQKMNETIADPKKRIPEEEMKPLIDTWRKANPNIVQLWWDTGKAAVNTVKTGQPHDVTKGISFWMAGKNLMLKLPSGRSISYVNAHLKKFWVGTVNKIVPDTFDEQLNPVYEQVKVKLGDVVTGSREEFDTMMKSKRLVQAKGVDPIQRESLCYWGSNQTTKKWEVIETYGPKLVQNFVEGWCRDLLMYSCLNMEKAGAPVVLTVHDELMVEPDKGKFTYEQLAALMIQKPKWATNMPLNCDGFLADYYKK